MIFEFLKSDRYRTKSLIMGGSNDPFGNSYTVW